MSLPTFIDLLALGADLGREIRFKNLHRTLEQAWRTQSCLGDLAQSADCCRVLETSLAVPRNRRVPDAMISERALLTTAVLLYVRATSTSGQDRERGAITLAKLTLAQRTDHKALLDLRNQALAHVYPSRKLGEREWHSVLMFAAELSPDRWRTASATNQTGFDPDTLRQLSRMLPVAQAFVLGKFRKAMGAVERHLAVAGLDRDALLRYQFDPINIFGNEATVRALLPEPHDEERTIWTSTSEIGVSD